MKSRGIRFLLENFLVIILNYGFHWISAQKLSPFDYGILSSLLGIFGILGVLGVSLQTKAAEIAARHQNTLQEHLKGSLLQTFFLGGLITLGGFLGAPFFAQILHTEPLIFIIFILIPLVNFPLSLIRGFLQGLQAFNKVSFSLLLESVLKLLFTLWGFSQGYDLKFILLLLTLSQIPSLFFGWWILKNYPHLDQEILSSPQNVPLKTLLSYFFLLGLWFNFDIIAFRSFFPELSGGYGLITKFGQIILFFALTLTTFSFPKLIEIHQKTPEKVKKTVHQFKRVLIGGEILGLGALFFFGETFSKFLFGTMIESAFPFLMPYAIYCSLIGIVHYKIHSTWASGDKGPLKRLWIVSILGFLFFISRLQNNPLEGIYALVLLGLILGVICQKTGKKFAPSWETP